MHKNPELTSMAKILAHELKGQGFELKHSQAMELVAKMHGARNLHVHQAALAAPVTEVSAEYGNITMLQDSKLASGGYIESELPELHHRVFQAEVKAYGDMIFVDLQLPGLTGDSLQSSDQLSLLVSVEDGRPSVHISNDRDSDKVLQVIGCEGGLYMSPTSTAYGIRTGVPGNESLLAVKKAMEVSYFPYNGSRDAFIPNPNA